MIDTKLSVRRYVTEFSNSTDELIAEYELDSFDMTEFRVWFKVPTSGNPMFESYPILAENVEFIENYMGIKPEWDFEMNSYFVEAVSI